MTQLGSIADEIRAKGADIAAAAVSATFSQIAFAAQLGIDVQLLSDWDGAVCGAFGVRYDEWKGHSGLAKRSLFVIDADGTIAYSWHNDNAEVLPDLEPMLAVVDAIYTGRME